VSNADELIVRLRAVCMALPEASERETWGDATFRVRDKIFAMGRGGTEINAIYCKARPGVQEMLVATDSERFFLPAYVGHNGWIGVNLNAGTDWEELEDLITESYRMTAPKRLSALIVVPGPSDSRG
jgi:predicted DNA-binding protein (MmcQ/YjbR family)